MGSQREEITKVTVVDRKSKPEWPEPVDTQYTSSYAAEAPAQKKATVVDTIASAAPAQKSPAAVQKTEESSPSFWSKIWSCLCSLVGQSPAPSAATGSSNKAGGDGVQPIGGAPTLEAPFQYDLKKFIQLLEEARQSLQQVQETNSEADKTEADEKRVSERSLKRFIEYLKAQQAIYGDAVVLGKITTVFDQKRHKTVRQELVNEKTYAIDAAKTDRSWGTWQKGAIFATVAISVSLVAIAVLPTAGLSLAAIPAMAAPTLNLLMPLATATQGITTLMKAASSQQLREIKGKITVGSHRERYLRQFKLPGDIKKMNRSMDDSFKVVTGYLKTIENNRDKAIKMIISPAA